MDDATRILSAVELDDARAAEHLLPLVYDELRMLAARRLAHEEPGQSLQATALRWQPLSATGLTPASGSTPS
jgi:hypothetical protein